MEIRRGRPEDLDGFCRLWRTCFGDDEEYLSFFLSRAYRPERVWFCLEDGAPVSMMTLLPCTERTGSRERAGAYVYAVATLPEYRRRGLMSRLHRAAEADCRRRGDAFLALVPAQPGLFAMYEKLGYRTCTSLWYHTIDLRRRRGGADTCFSPMDGEAFARLRGEYLAHRRSAVYLSGDCLGYTFAELGEAGYEVCLAENELGRGYLVCRMVEPDALLIRETSLERRAFAAALAAMGERFGAGTVFFKAAHSWFSPAEKRPYGMMKRLDGAGARFGCYMNLMLDD